MSRVSRAALAAVLLATGCANGVLPLEELPDAPIAVLYRTPVEARERAERLEDAEERRGGSPGALDVSDLERVLDAAATRLPARVQGRLALVDPGSGEVRVLESAQRGAQPFAWSGDRRRLLIASLRGPALQVFELELASLELRQLTRGPQQHAGASYGPDGRFAFAAVESVDPPRVRILRTGPGGRAPEPVTAGPWDRSPVWSPDGETLAFTTGQPGREDAVAVLQGDAEPRRLARGRDPAFTPDGAWIVYSARRREGWRLWRMRPDGSGRAPLGLGRTDELHPAVSPDGRFVAYVAEEAGRHSLRVRRFDGTGDRALVTDGDASHPVW